MGTNERVKWGILHKNTCKQNFNSEKAVGVSVALTKIVFGITEWLMYSVWNAFPRKIRVMYVELNLVS